MVFVLRDFIITKLLSFQTCLILKSSLLLLIHSRPFLLLRLPYFIATVSLAYSAFFGLVFVGEGERSPSVPPVIYNKVPIQHAIRLAEKACFSTSLHGAVNSWVNAI